MYLKGFNQCMEEIIKNCNNTLFSNSLFIHVVYPLRNIIKGWDEWFDTEMKQIDHKSKKVLKIQS